MKQKLLDFLCTWIGHDWREKDDPKGRTCLTCGAVKSVTDGHPRSLPEHEMHAPAGRNSSAVETERKDGERLEAPTKDSL
jgi:hypothetical protein